MEETGKEEEDELLSLSSDSVLSTGLVVVAADDELAGGEDG